MTVPRRAWAAALACLGAVVVTACTPAGGVTPTPSPTYSCSVAIGECTPQQAAKEAKAAQDHEAARLALQAGLDELYRLDVDKTASTSDLTKYFAGEELAGAVDSIKRFRQSSRKAHGTVKVVSTTFQTKYPDTSQLVDVCEDATGFHTTDAKGEDKRPGSARTYTATMSLMDGSWKRSFSTDSVEVKQC